MMLLLDLSHRARAHAFCLGYKTVLRIALISCVMLVFPVHTKGAEPRVVISQVYGEGGAASAFGADYIELKNIGDAAQDLSGWTIQLAIATGSFCFKVHLTAETLQPGQYYLVRMGANRGGRAIPEPNVTSSVAINGSNLKIVLVNSAAKITGHSSSQVVDFVGFGSAANDFEGTGPAPTHSATTALTRKIEGCLDSHNNATDFEVIPPNPHNSSTTRPRVNEARAFTARYKTVSPRGFAVF